MERTQYLDPEAIPLIYDERVPADPAPAITLLWQEWEGPGNPAPVLRGTVMRACNAGQVLLTREIADVHPRDLDQEATRPLRLAFVGTLGQHHLNALAERIADMDDGWTGTPYAVKAGAHWKEHDRVMAARTEFRRTYHQQRRAGDVAPDVAELAATLERQQENLKELVSERDWAQLDLAVHLARLGMKPSHVDRYAYAKANVGSILRLQLLTATQVAHLLGIDSATWTSYVARDQAPAPYHHVGREPVWTLAQVDEYLAKRTKTRGARRISRAAHVEGQTT
ncbi:helix-turn-helix transcriptional regulator [Streptomyces noursei]